MPLSDAAWTLIVAASGGVQGKAFWMSRRTWVALLAERPSRHRGKLYSVPVCFDDSLVFGAIRLERRNAK